MGYWSECEEVLVDKTAARIRPRRLFLDVIRLPFGGGHRLGPRIYFMVSSGLQADYKFSEGSTV